MRNVFQCHFARDNTFSQKMAGAALVILSVSLSTAKIAYALKVKEF
jgi:hypothetical protein